MRISDWSSDVCSADLGRQYDQSHAVGGLARIGQCLPRGFDGEAYRCLSFRRDMAEADAASLHNPLVCRVDASLDQPGVADISSRTRGTRDDNKRAKHYAIYQMPGRT